MAITHLGGGRAAVGPDVLSCCVAGYVHVELALEADRDVARLEGVRLAPSVAKGDTGMSMALGESGSNIAAPTPSGRSVRHFAASHGPVTQMLPRIGPSCPSQGPSMHQLSGNAG